MTILGEIHLPPPPEWMSLGVCATTDPEAFFPEKGGSTKEAKRICWNSCEAKVREQCLAYALENDERYGVWGGLTERERRKLKQKPPRAPQDMNPRPCEYCGTVFVPWRDTARFCSKRCNLDNVNAQRNKDKRDKAPGPGISRPSLSDPQLNRPFVAMCRTCGVEFNANNPTTRYCTDECHRLATKAQERQRYRGRA